MQVFKKYPVYWYTVGHLLSLHIRNLYCLTWTCWCWLGTCCLLHPGPWSSSRCLHTRWRKLPENTNHYKLVQRQGRTHYKLVIGQGNTVTKAKQYETPRNAYWNLRKTIIKSHRRQGQALTKSYKYKVGIQTNYVTVVLRQGETNNS